MPIQYVVIGLGGAVGALSRVLLSKIMPVFILSSIPFPILFVNVFGCFLMGLVSELLSPYEPNLLIRSFLIPGFWGGFTTFSAFTFEFGNLIEKNLYYSALCYAMLSVFASVICFFLGIKLIKIFQ
jgi:CrcB protein